jgi:hypothetical protein
LCLNSWRTCIDCEVLITLSYHFCQQAVDSLPRATRVLFFHLFSAGSYAANSTEHAGLALPSMLPTCILATWEHADDPRYPERFSSYAYRMGINYIIYPMTH